MGVTISSKRVSLDLGYAGFNRFRETVANQISKEVGDHYAVISDSSVMCLMNDERKAYFEAYDKKTTELIEEDKLPIEVAHFLYQPDSQGKIDRKQAKIIYQLIKDCDDNIVYGYTGRPDCTKMSDMKRLFSDNTKIEWF